MWHYWIYRKRKRGAHYPDGLKRLEYRGYDSAIAVMNEDGFDVVKQKGRPSALEEL